MNTLWIVVARPQQLLTALAIRDQIGAGFARTELLVDSHAAWERADWRGLAAGFDAIHEIQRVRPPHGLLGSFRTYRETKQLSERIAALPMNAADLLISCMYFSPLVNALLSHHPGCHKLLITEPRKYADFRRPVNTTSHRHTSASWINHHVVDRLCGLIPTYNLKQRGAQDTDGIWLRRYQRDMDELFQRVIVTERRDDCAQTDDQTWHSSTPRLPVRASGDDNTPRVIFFGTPFLLLKNLDAGIYIDKLNDCLRQIEAHHPDCDFHYRPHPGEKDEPHRLELGRFTLDDDKEAAELHLMKLGDAVRATYTVSSGAVRGAMEMGFPAYALWPSFPFGEDARGFFERVMGHVPEGFLIDDPSQPPREYLNAMPEEDAFAQCLQAAYTDYQQRRKTHP